MLYLCIELRMPHIVPGIIANQQIAVASTKIYFRDTHKGKLNTMVGVSILSSAFCV